MKEIFAIIGKLPLRNFSKTRLAKEVGADLSIDLYSAFIKDFSFNLKGSKFKKIYFFGTPNTAETKSHFLKEFEGLDIFYFPQEEIPFFQRLGKIFQTIKELEGESFIHLTGTDIPDFPFGELEKVTPDSNKVFLGPDKDGGFYYLGASSNHFEVFDFKILDSVLESICKKIRELGLEISHLKTWSDIDNLKGLLEALKRSPKEKISHTAAIFNSSLKLNNETLPFG